MEKIVAFKIDPKKFDIKKEYRVRELKNFETWVPCSQSDYYLETTLSEKLWTIKELLQITNGNLWIYGIIFLFFNLL